MTAVAKPRAKRLPAWAASAEALRAKWVSHIHANGFGERVLEALALPDRCLRLLAVAQCRHPEIWAGMIDLRASDAVEVAEHYAEGTCGEAVRQAAWASAGDCMTSRSTLGAFRACGFRAMSSAVWTLHYCSESDIQSSEHAHESDMVAYQARLLVAVVGPGWRFSPAWRTSDAVALARVMYDARDFSAMPILADELYGAGAPDGPMLEQMRDPEQPWCRGARIVDEVLGKR